MTAFTHIHSFFAWTLLILLILSIIIAIVKSRSNADFRNPAKALFLITLILTHLQVILGFVLYFSSPKVVFSGETMSESLFRFFTLEHPLLMLVAVIMVTIGFSKAKKATSTKLKFKRVYVYYLIGLILILLRFPWNYLTGIGSGWF